MADYAKMSKEILDAVGGKDNVSNAVHCMTRLRLVVKDKSKVNEAAVKQVNGVLGAQFSGEQFQVIIGTTVSDVYPVFCKEAGIGEETAIDENLDKDLKEPFSWKKVPGQILDYVSGSVAPTIPIMMAAGFFKMFYSIFGPDLLNIASTESNVMQTLYIVGNAGFYFMPVFAAWSAAKKEKTSVALALLLGVLLIDPNIVNIVSAGEPFKIYGLFPMQLNDYSQSLLPILLTVWILKYVYAFFDKHMPKSIRVFGTPFCTMLVMVPLMFCVLAPIGNWIGLGLAAFFNALYKVAGPVAVALIGAFWPFLIATGMHIAVIQIAILNITTIGYDPIVLAGSNIANYAMMGMVVAMFIRSKGEEKELAGANALTLIVGGVSEPTIFGILLRNKRAMIAQIIGGGIGGLVGGLMHVAVYQFGASNFLTVLQYAGGSKSNFICACIACAVAFAAALVAGLIAGTGSKKEKAVQNA